MEFLRLKSIAKLNIGLNIISKRDDGYHNLETIFYPVRDLYDRITIKKSSSLSFRCNVPSLIDDKSNLILKAVKLLEEKRGKRLPVNIECIKAIPMGGGLGGGSSNAAFILNGINELYNLGISKNKLYEYALELGSDVPFFIDGDPAAGYSRGEILKKISLDIPYPILIVNPGIHVSTAEAFAGISTHGKSTALLERLNKCGNDLKGWRDQFSNDFEETVFRKHPEIGELKEVLYKNDAMFASMSGSGSTVYGIFKNLDVAISAKTKLPGNYFAFISL